MITNQAVINSAYSKCSKDISILYEPTNHIFDYFMQGVTGQLFYLNKTENYYHDMLIYHNVNNAQLQEKIKNDHLKSLLLIHSSPGPALKKEDIFIFRENISSVNKIIFDKTVANNWGFSDDDGHIMNYGIPKIELPKEKSIPVVVLNFDNNPQIDNLYQHIQAQIPDCMIIKNVNNTNYWGNIANIIANTKIVIDITQKFNVLFALGCGCQTISTFKNIDSEFNNTIDDFNSVVHMINDLLKKPINSHEEMQQDTLNKYPYEQFINMLNNIISQVKSQEVFYV